MRYVTLQNLALLGAVAMAGACAGRDHARTDDAEIGELERRALGPAQAYPADVYSDADAERFATSKKARRELGWRVLAKVLRPIAIQAQPPAPGVIEPDAGAAPTRTVPLFRTWLGGDEVEAMFEQMLFVLGPERRRQRAAPNADEIQGLFDWNASFAGGHSEADYLARLGKLTNSEAIDGLGGNARTAYSPGYLKQYLTDYPAAAGCEGKLASFGFDTPAPSEANFTNCFSREFSSDAAVVKTAWRRNDAFKPDNVPVHDTSAATLRARLAGELDEGGWPNGKTVPRVSPSPADAYTIELSERDRYVLGGLHIISKELRHWVWVSIWWSSTPDEDFGQDRPEEIAKLGAFRNYKMCVVTDYEERDPDPRGGFGGSLGDALEATHGTLSWCSNPFIERGARNAGTNCIGCHQHAGDMTTLRSVLADPVRFPGGARQRLRKSFPADYSWAFAVPGDGTNAPDTVGELLQPMVVRHLAEWDRRDATAPP